MKRGLALILTLAGLPAVLFAQASHLDIMVPDLRDTDLKGPVKSVELKVCRNVSGEFSTEKKEYDRAGNLLKTTEHNEEGKLEVTNQYIYDENGCYERRIYNNEKEDFSSEWEVVLSPETRQIALREIEDGRIGLETYSPEGYIVSYRLMNKDREPILAYNYKRDENNRLTMFTRIEDRTPDYTYYFKWADNGLMDMEAQTYHQEKQTFRHTYEYLVADDFGNWTQRILVRYDIGGKKPEKVYEHTVQRTIEYYEEGGDAATGDENSAAGNAAAGNGKADV
ncbi:MAG TPA: hypothetical protein VLL07_07025 [Pontiella sp.]|nr:hypothetical protein [Pontiella sp.]